MLSARFVSDIHIENKADPKARLFLSFLKGCNRGNCTHLVLLGDIFDFWIADHSVFVREYAEIIAEVERLRWEQVEIHYFEGNHDLHLKKFWRNQLGCEVHEGPAYFQLGEKAFRVEHGDQMDPEDKGYLFLRWLLRTPALKVLAHRLPGTLVHKIGQRSSSTSRNYTSETKTISQNTAREKIRAHAEKVHSEKPFDYIVTGHVHVRDHCKLTSGAESWNLGTWLNEPGYLEFNEKSQPLVQWHSLRGKE